MRQLRFSLKDLTKLEKLVVITDNRPKNSRLKIEKRDKSI
jgi:hypothetical protein